MEFIGSTAGFEMRSHLHILEPLAKASLLLIAGAIAAIYASTLAYSLLSIGCALFCGTVALKVYSLYNEEDCVNLYMQMAEFDLAYPYLPLLSFIVTLALNVLCPPLAAVCGVAVGVYNSLLLRFRQCRQLQTSSPRTASEGVGVPV